MYFFFLYSFMFALIPRPLSECVTEILSTAFTFTVFRVTLLLHFFHLKHKVWFFFLFLMQQFGDFGEESDFEGLVCSFSVSGIC